jgi:hypothetical protein
MEQKSKELLIRNEYLRNNIYNLEKQIKILKNEIKENESNIRKLCKHKWERDYDYEYHNEKFYYCSKCKLMM